MTDYRLVRDSDGTVKHLENHKGEIVWEYDGTGFDRNSKDFQEAILDSANFGQPQKAALRALIGEYDEMVEANDS